MSPPHRVDSLSHSYPVFTPSHFWEVFKFSSSSLINYAYFTVVFKDTLAIMPYIITYYNLTQIITLPASSLPQIAGLLEHINSIYSTSPAPPHTLNCHTFPFSSTWYPKYCIFFTVTIHSSVHIFTLSGVRHSLLLFHISFWNYFPSLKWHIASVFVCWRHPYFIFMCKW